MQAKLTTTTITILVQSIIFLKIPSRAIEMAGRQGVGWGGCWVGGVVKMLAAGPDSPSLTPPGSVVEREK